MATVHLDALAANWRRTERLLEQARRLRGETRETIATSRNLRHVRHLHRLLVQRGLAIPAFASSVGATTTPSY